MRAEAIAALSQWIEPQERDRVLGVVRAIDRDPGSSVDEVIRPWITQWLTKPDAPMQSELMRAASALDINVGDVTWISDSRRNVDARIELLNQMLGRDDPDLARALDAAIWFFGLRLLHRRRLR